MYKITGREVMWDMFLADKCEGITLEMHKPVRKNIAMECDQPWEGVHFCYSSIIYDGEKYRMYYRGKGKNPLVCVAFSNDGKTFYKPNLGLYEHNGSKDNNIVYQEDRYIDNFAVFYDTNPNCPENEKYKALSNCDFVIEEDGSLSKVEALADDSMTRDPNREYTNRLALYVSGDGLDFKFVRHLDVVGAFDSFNVGMWDEELGKYRLYYRGYHTIEAFGEEKIEYEQENHVRDVRLATSTDFINWTEEGLLDYGEDNLAIQLYTNCISKYHRANIFFGLPTRYIDRLPDIKNFKHLPPLKGQRMPWIEAECRAGSAITEAMIMTSRDGKKFNRTNEAFLGPGIERDDNWVYGDGYINKGFIETTSDFKGEPNEISLYSGTGYRSRGVSVERFTVRMDGFFSWSADFEGGEALTKPFIFEGNEMSVNFATSALGYLQIIFCDQDGNELDGYDSGRLFGNTIDRPCEFDNHLSSLNGKTVRMKIKMKDAEFYSFIFE